MRKEKSSGGEEGCKVGGVEGGRSKGSGQRGMAMKMGLVLLDI